MSDGVLPGQLVVIWWKRWWRKRPGSHHLRCGRRTAGVRRRKPHQQQQPSRFVSFPFMIFSSFLWLCGTSKSNQIYIFTTLSAHCVQTSLFFFFFFRFDNRRRRKTGKLRFRRRSRRCFEALRQHLASPVAKWKLGEKSRKIGTTRRKAPNTTDFSFWCVMNSFFLSFFFLIFIFFQAPLFLLASI